MLTKIGKVIEIRTGATSKFVVTRTSDAPGVMTVRESETRAIHVHCTDVEFLVAALRRARDEDIEYRTAEFENAVAT